MSSKLKWYRFRLRTLTIVILIVLSGPSYLGFRLYSALRVLPMGEGSAGPAVSPGDFEEVWCEGKVVLVGIGDSITNGLGASREHHYYALLQGNDDEAYPDMAGRDLGVVLPGLTAENYALDYTTSKQHVERQLLRVAVQAQDVRGIVVVTSGGNDLIHDYGRSEPVDGAMYGCSYGQAVVWTENIKDRIDKLLLGIMERFPGGCDIFLANIYDPTDGVGDPQIKGLPRWRSSSRIVELTNAKISELCAEYENVHLVDIHTEFLGHGFHCRQWWRRHYRADDPHYWYYSNIEDPNPRGYDAIRRLFLLEMVRVLPERMQK